MPVMRRVLPLILAALLAGCAPQRVALDQLATHQEAFAGQRVTTDGMVVRFADPDGGVYYVLEDDRHDRVAVVPAALVAPHLGERVVVTGTFAVVAGEGRTIRVETIASASDG